MEVLRPRRKSPRILLGLQGKPSKARWKSLDRDENRLEVCLVFRESLARQVEVLRPRRKSTRSLLGLQGKPSKARLKSLDREENRLEVCLVSRESLAGSGGSP